MIWIAICRNLDENQRFDKILDKLVKDKKIDKSMLLAKLKSSFQENEMEGQTILKG
jgi:hypothetical protein